MIEVEYVDEAGDQLAKAPMPENWSVPSHAKAYEVKPGCHRVTISSDYLGHIPKGESTPWTEEEEDALQKGFKMFDINPSAIKCHAVDVLAGRSVLEVVAKIIPTRGKPLLPPPLPPAPPRSPAPPVLLKPIVSSKSVKRKPIYSDEDDDEATEDEEKTDDDEDYREKPLKRLKQDSKRKDSGKKSITSPPVRAIEKKVEEKKPPPKPVTNGKPSTRIIKTKEETKNDKPIAPKTSIGKTILPKSVLLKPLLPKTAPPSTIKPPVKPPAKPLPPSSNNAPTAEVVEIKAAPESPKEIEPKLTEVELTEMVCNVCFSGECGVSNDILCCTKCHVFVHQGCYGIEIPPKEFVCVKCVKADAGVSVVCCLCPHKSGAFQPTKEGRYAHSACAMWIPGAKFEDGLKMAPILTKAIAPSVSQHKCICCDKPGACVKCVSKGCHRYFHVLCGYNCGLTLRFQKIPSDRAQSQRDYALLTYCHHHKDTSFEEWIAEHRPPKVKTQHRPPAVSASKPAPPKLPAPKPPVKAPPPKVAKTSASSSASSLARSTTSSSTSTVASTSVNTSAIDSSSAQSASGSAATPVDLSEEEAELIPEGNFDSASSTSETSATVQIPTSDEASQTTSSTNAASTPTSKTESAKSTSANSKVVGKPATTPKSSTTKPAATKAVTSAKPGSTVKGSVAGAKPGASKPAAVKSATTSTPTKTVVKKPVAKSPASTSSTSASTSTSASLAVSTNGTPTTAVADGKQPGTPVAPKEDVEDWKAVMKEMENSSSIQARTDFAQNRLLNASEADFVSFAPVCVKLGGLATIRSWLRYSLDKAADAPSEALVLLLFKALKRLATYYRYPDKHAKVLGVGRAIAESEEGILKDVVHKATASSSDAISKAACELNWSTKKPLARKPVKPPPVAVKPVESTNEPSSASTEVQIPSLISLDTDNPASPTSALATAAPSPGGAGMIPTEASEETTVSSSQTSAESSIDLTASPERSVLTPTSPSTSLSTPDSTRNTETNPSSSLSNQQSSSSSADESSESSASSSSQTIPESLSSDLIEPSSSFSTSDIIVPSSTNNSSLPTSTTSTSSDATTTTPDTIATTSATSVEFGTPPLTPSESPTFTPLPSLAVSSSSFANASPSTYTSVPYVTLSPTSSPIGTPLHSPRSPSFSPARSPLQPPPTSPQTPAMSPNSDFSSSPSPSPSPSRSSSHLSPLALPSAALSPPPSITLSSISASSTLPSSSDSPPFSPGLLATPEPLITSTSSETATAASPLETTPLESLQIESTIATEASATTDITPPSSPPLAATPPASPLAATPPDSMSPKDLSLEDVPLVVSALPSSDVSVSPSLLASSSPSSPSSLSLAVPTEATSSTPEVTSIETSIPSISLSSTVVTTPITATATTPAPTLSSKVECSSITLPVKKYDVLKTNSRELALLLNSSTSAVPNFSAASLDFGDWEESDSDAASVGGSPRAPVEPLKPPPEIAPYESPASVISDEDIPTRRDRKDSKKKSKRSSSSSSSSRHSHSGHKSSSKTPKSSRSKSNSSSGSKHSSSSSSSRSGSSSSSSNNSSSGSKSQDEKKRIYSKTPTPASMPSPQPEILVNETDIVVPEITLDFSAQTSSSPPLSPTSSVPPLVLPAPSLSIDQELRPSSPLQSSTPRLPPESPPMSPDSDGDHSVGGSPRIAPQPVEIPPPQLQVPPLPASLPPSLPPTEALSMNSLMSLVTPDKLAFKNRYVRERITPSTPAPSPADSSSYSSFSSTSSASSSIPSSCSSSSASSSSSSLSSSTSAIPSFPPLPSAPLSPRLTQALPPSSLPLSLPALPPGFPPFGPGFPPPPFGMFPPPPGFPPFPFLPPGFPMMGGFPPMMLKDCICGTPYPSPDATFCEKCGTTRRFPPMPMSVVNKINASLQSPLPGTSSLSSSVQPSSQLPSLPSFAPAPENWQQRPRSRSRSREKGRPKTRERSPPSTLGIPSFMPSFSSSVVVAGAQTKDSGMKGRNEDDRQRRNEEDRQQRRSSSRSSSPSGRSRERDRKRRSSPPKEIQDNRLPPQNQNSFQGGMRTPHTAAELELEFFVAGLGDLTEDQLYKRFSEFGQLNYVKVPPPKADQRDGVVRPRGFGFIRFADEMGVKNLQKMLKNKNEPTVLIGETLVDVRYQPDRPDYKRQQMQQTQQNWNRPNTQNWKEPRDGGAFNGTRERDNRDRNRREGSRW